MRPGLLAVRAVNQYRSRDILAYLGLRYYLDNDCAKNDIWVKDIATHLVKTRQTPIYYRLFHFKEIVQDDIVHREIYLPGPNEILAESALLHDCSKDEAFKALECVYSYYFPHSSSKEGIFQNYFPGFEQRNHSIARTCKDLGETTKVLYTDIKKFYPSISHELALKAWQSTCDASQISVESRQLGEELLGQYTKRAVTTPENTAVHILTGPMFSHLIANLVLSKVDRYMFQYTKKKYWRYVDDFVLAGTPHQVEQGRVQLHAILSDMGFQLHDTGKDFQIDSTEWLEVTRKFDNSKSKIWASLIGNIKRFLLTKPEAKGDLEQAFAGIGINIPLKNYSDAVLESSYREKFYDWLQKYSWASNAIRNLTVDSLVREALQARKDYYDCMVTFLDEDLFHVQGYKRKQWLSTLRFYAKRLTYLGTPDMLSSIGSALDRYPELYLQSKIMSAIQSRDVSLLIQLGTNAVQAAAQILRLQNQPVTCSLDSLGQVELQGLAVLLLNGIHVNFASGISDQIRSDSLNQFALGQNLAHLMQSEDLFIREIACLHGIQSHPKHQNILDNAFDRHEQLSFDMIDLLHPSSYF